jgi:NAD(P)-dependent dehydrogenase (short-subunit alcohol dehydrogenase family)
LNVKIVAAEPDLRRYFRDIGNAIFSKGECGRTADRNAICCPRRPALAQVPFHRMGNPEEIAEMVVWLCSDRASYVSGAAYNVDGGWMAI